MLPKLAFNFIFFKLWKDNDICEDFKTSWILPSTSRCNTVPSPLPHFTAVPFSHSRVVVWYLTEAFEL
jgi:hypothetical protein